MPKDKEEKKNPKVVVEEVEETPEEEPKAEEKVVEEVEKAEKEPVVEEKTEPTEEPKIEKSEDKPGVGKLLWIIIPTTLLVGALAGGVITYFSGLQISQGPEPTPVATVSPTEDKMVEDNTTTETASTLKREDLKIQVLNGSGVAGAAGKAKDFLEGLGYTDVAVGNADASNYQETEISVLEEKSDYLDLLKKDLSEKYTLASDTGNLSGSSSYDVVITLGSK